MEMDNILDESSAPGPNLIINQTIRDFLAESARWGKFLAIVGFVFLGLGLIGTIVFLGAGSALAGDEFAGFGIFITLIYLVLIGISAIPVYYLFLFSTKTQIALRDEDQAYLVDAFQNHKSMFKFYGIFMAIALGIYALAFIIGIIGAVVGLG